MTRFLTAFCLSLFWFQISSGQSIEGTWNFESITDSSDIELYPITSNDSLVINAGNFIYDLDSKNLNAKGHYLYQNKLLVFYYTEPKDTVRTYVVDQLSESSLVLRENSISYEFKKSEVILSNQTETIPDNSIIKSKGFSMTSLWRGG